MSNFYEEVSCKILNSKGYALATEELFRAYVCKMVQVSSNLCKQTIKKLATSVQFFYLSGVEEYVNEGAIILSMLLHVAGEKERELVAIAENVYYGSGDFPNVALIKKKFQDINFRVSIYDESRKNLKADLNTVQEIDHPLTDYQRSLWEDLVSDKDVITSAPTSTGKTDIILRYLMQKMMEDESGFAAVVVPTRALISEVAGKIYELAKSKSYEHNIHVCTVPKEGRFQEKTFFVMTQERLFELLQPGDMYFNYLFIDEAHNISDKSRGVLLHLTLQKLLEDSNPQIIISMPSHQYMNAFDSVFDGISFLKVRTRHSPVAKVVMPLTFTGRKINISRINSKSSISIDKNFTGKSIANIVYRLGQGESNILYRNQTDHCENAAREIAALVTKNKDCPALEEAADYIERFLHKDFSLASSLRKGVAFHYSPLPGVIRTMIEDLVREGKVDFVVCTSTLAEGVNLPAKNLFLQNPLQRAMYEKSTRLENVKLDNITGRAGRMLEHFAGNIFLVEHDDWEFKDYFEDADEVSRIPTYFKVLNEDLGGVIDALKGEYDHNKSDQFTYYTIANKLIKEFSSDILSSTLNSDALNLTRKDRKQLETSVEQAYDALKVAAFTLEASPTVGFIQQNKVYNLLIGTTDLSEWVLPHPKSPLLYDRLKHICHVLSENGIFIPTADNTIGHVCVIAKKWMTGEPLKEIIASQIAYERERGKKYNCNKSVRNVIKVVNTDVRFRLSTALRCYHSLITDVIGARKMDMQSVKIYSFIEVGGCEERIINLVNLGFSRETALEIDRVLPKGLEIHSITDVKRQHEGGMFDKLHAVTRREIIRVLL